MNETKSKKTINFLILGIILLISIIFIIILIQYENIDIKEMKIPELSNNELEKIAREKIDKYLMLRLYNNDSNVLGGTAGILKELNLETEENLNKLSFSENECIKTDVKYDVFKKAMLEYISPKLFEEKYSIYKNLDGYVGVFNGAGGFLIETVQNVEVVSVNEYECEFKTTLRDEELYEHYLTNDGYIEESECFRNINVVCKYINNNLVISEIKY